MNNVHQLHEQQDGFSHKLAKLEGVLGALVDEQNEIRTMLLEMRAQQAINQQRQTEVLIQAMQDALASRATPAAAPVW